MMKIPFTKMHGCGNDYIYVYCSKHSVTNPTATAIAWGEAALFVSMGNPHYVIFTDDIDKVSDAGPKLERHPAFPQRCNIEFVQVIPPSVAQEVLLRTRVWERGSGITQACGTGACATAVAAFVTGRAGRQSQIIMDGGTLSIEWRESDNHVYMTGPATFVYDGEIELIKNE